MISNLLLKIEPIDEKINTECFLYLSTSLQTKWKLKANSTITVCIGTQTQFVQVRTIDIAINEVQIPKELLHKWHLPCQAYTVHGHYFSSNETLHLAPIIGLLTEINEDQPDNPHFKSIHSFCEELDHITKQFGGIFYVFPLQQLTNTFITGFMYQEGNWIKCKLPLPNSIYNRIHSRNLESSEAFQTFRNQIQELQIPMFNDRFLSKWEVYHVLMTEEHLHPHLPKTMLFSKKNLEEMLATFPLLFLKPIHGSQGRNIIRIEQQDTSFRLKLSFLPEADFSIATINELHEALAPYIKKKAYLIQQGLSFIQYQQRHMDFRILCHKNNQGIWNVTSVVARLSAEKQFVSNIARGGETMKPIKALSLYFESKIAKQLLVMIKELAIEFAQIISQNSIGLTGELGIDMGIDFEGNPWIIEANSKPSKNFEEQEIKIRPSAKAIISYCFQLAFEHNKLKEEK